MSNQRHRALVALGTNMPMRDLAGPVLLAAAVNAMEQAGLRVVSRSGVWETDPWPPSAQAPYHNAVVALETSAGDPRALFEELRSIEREFGRERRERWGPRTLDLDILDFDGQAGQFGDLTIPHARLAERAFVLAPLAEAAPAWRHPVTARSAAELLSGLPPGQGVRRVAEPGAWPPFAGAAALRIAENRDPP